MPLLAEAYAEVRLRMGAEFDADLARVRERLERLSASVDVDLGDVSGLVAGVQGVVEGVERTSAARVDVELGDVSGVLEGVAALRASLEALDAVTVTVSADVSEALARLGEVQATVAALDADTVNIGVDVFGHDRVAAVLAGLDVLKRRAAGLVTVTVDVSGLSAAVAELEVLRVLAREGAELEVRLSGVEQVAAQLELLAGLAGRVSVDVDVDGDARLEELRARLVSLPQRVDVHVDVDVRGAERLEVLRARLARRFEVDVRVDSGRARVAVDELLERLRRLTRRVWRANVFVSIDGGEQLRRLVDRLQRLDRRVYVAAVRVAVRGLGDLRRLEERLARVALRTVQLDVEVDTAAAMLNLEAFDLLRRRVDGRDVNVDVDVDVARASAELAAFDVLVARVTDQVRDRFRSGEFGARLPAGYAGLVTGLAAAAAAAAPLVPALTGAAAAMIGMGAAAGVAAAGLAGLGVAFNDLAVRDLKDQLTVLRTELVAAFRPVADQVAKVAAPALSVVARDLVAAVAPAAAASVAPLTESVAAFAATVSRSLLPVIEPLRDGLITVVDALGVWAPTAGAVAATVAGPLADALAALVDLLGGTAVEGARLWQAALSGFAAVARRAVGPLNEVTAAIRGVFSGSGDEFLAVVGQAGRLLGEFSAGVAKVSSVLLDAVASNGLEESLLAVAGALSFVSPAATGVVLALTHLNELADMLGRAFESLGFENLAVLAGLVVSAFNPLAGVLVVLSGELDSVVELIGKLVDNVLPVAVPVLDTLRAALELVVKAAAGFVSGLADMFDGGELAAKLAPLAAMLKALFAYLSDPRVFEQFGKAFGVVLKPLLQGAAEVVAWFAGRLPAALAQLLETVRLFAVTNLNLFAAVGDAVAFVARYVAGPLTDSFVAFAKPVAVVVDGIAGLVGKSPELAAKLDAVRAKVAAVDDSASRFADRMRDASAGIAGFVDRTAPVLRRFTELYDRFKAGELTFDEYVAALGLVERGLRSQVGAVTESERVLRKLHGEYRAGKRSLGSYLQELVKLGRVAPSVAAALNRLQKTVAEPPTFADLADRVRDRMRVEKDRLTGVGRSVSSALGLSFTVDDDTRSKAVGSVKTLADDIDRVLNRFKLSEFFTKETFNVKWALERLARTVEVQAENFGRLGSLERLGFKNLAAQLATLSNDPFLLAKALDQLFALGVDTLLSYERRLAQAGAAVAAQARNVGPAVGEQLGVGVREGVTEAEEQVRGSVKSFTSVLRDALDTVRVQADNVRRLVQLERMGFRALALELANIGDPKGLQQALNELFGAGIAAIRSANNQIVSAINETSAAVAQASPELREALGAPVEQAAADVREGTVTLRDVILERGKVLADALAVTDAVIMLAEAGFRNIAAELSRIEDLDVAKQIVDSFASMSAEGLRAAEAELAAQQRLAVDALNERLNRVFSTLGVDVASAERVADEYRAAGAKIAASLNDWWSNLFTGPPSGTAASERGRVEAEAYKNGLTSALDSFKVNTAQVWAGRGAVGGPLFAAKAAGAGAALAYVTSAASTLTSLTGVVERAVGAMAGPLTVAARRAAVSFGSGVADGIADTVDKLVDVAKLVGLTVGLSFRAALTATGGETVAVFGKAVAAAVGRLPTLVGDLASLSGALIGSAFLDGFNRGLLSRVPEVTATTSKVVGMVAEAARRAAGVRSPSRVAAVIGAQWVDGLVAGLESRTDAVVAAAERVAEATAKAFNATTLDVVGRLFDEPQLVKVEPVVNMSRLVELPVIAAEQPGVAQAASTTPTATVEPDRMDRLIAVLERIERPLFGEYHVHVDAPPPPDQLARDAVYARAMLG